MLGAHKKHPQARCFVEPPPSVAVLKHPFRKPFEIDGVDTRRKHKLTAGVSLIRWGLICAQQRSRYAVYFKRTRGCISHDTPAHIKTVYLLQKDLQTQSREQRSCSWVGNEKTSCGRCYEWHDGENAEQIWAIAVFRLKRHNGLCSHRWVFYCPQTTYTARLMCMG